MRKLMLWRAVGLAVVLAGSQPSHAQDGPRAVDPAAVPMPVVAFTPTEEDVRNYDKYFYFHRVGADFASAYADLVECDGYGRGLSFYASAPGGGLLGSVLSDAVFGSAERRRQRRINIRTCMGFKGYRTYGLSKSLWEEFNFEEGGAAVEESRRQRLLQMQARVASGPAPTVGEITE